MFSGLDFSNLRLITNYWVRFSIRTGGGLMALFAILGLGLWTANLVISPIDISMSMAPEAGYSQDASAADIAELAQSEVGESVVEFLTGASPEQADYLLKKNPALLSAIWLVLILVFPFIACVAGFNQTAGEIGTRGLRYILLRTARVNVFLGRFVGAFLFCACSAALMTLLLVTYIGVKLNVYELGDMLWWALQGYIALMLVALPYLALCAWVSAMLDSAFGSLALCFAAVGGSIIVLKMADWTTRGVDLEWLTLLVPWGWKHDLLAGDVGVRLLAYGVMIGFTLVFLLLGLRTFSRRDL